MGLGLLELFGGSLIGGLWLIFIGMFLRGAARAGYHGVVVERALATVKVRDLMVTDPVIVPGDLTVSEAIEEQFLRHGFGRFPVGNSGQTEGLVSLSDALRQMLTFGSSRLLVTDGGRVIGLITLSGAMRFIQLKTELEEEQQ
jgi:CBS domain-containing protein